MTTQGLVLIEFSDGRTNVVHIQDWAIFAARGLGVTTDDLWRCEIMGVGYGSIGYPFTHMYEKDGNKVRMQSMNSFREL